MKRIPVFYSPHMVADTRSISPSAGKAAAVIADWHKAELPIEEVAFTPAAHLTLALAHPKAYVEDIMDCREPNGFGNREQSVAQALPWQVGSLRSAAFYVAGDIIEPGRAGPRRVACSPSSGFHHAHHSRAEGFCTFNGLIISAMDLKRRGMVGHVGILDMDFHWGNGTDDIINTLGLDWITHVSGAQLNGDAEEILGHLDIVTKSFKGCDLLIYQAGADQHINDPLGGLFTTEQMARRDRTVFWTAREYGIPLVWNLAGGYQRDLNGSIAPVLALHRQTMAQCVDIYVNDGKLRP